jgi:hypothetical protein
MYKNVDHLVHLVPTSSVQTVPTVANFQTSGIRFDYRDPELMDLTRKVNEALLDGGPKFRIIYLFPWLRKFKWYRTFQDSRYRIRVRLFVLVAMTMNINLHIFYMLYDS